jgi:hypothetical protein
MKFDKDLGLPGSIEVAPDKVSVVNHSHVRRAKLG